MKNQDLLDLRAGRISFREFARAHERAYVYRLAQHFFHRYGWLYHPVDIEDLRQIGLLELWAAVEAYQFRCPSCPLRTESPLAFSMHAIEHQPRVQPRPRLIDYVHSRVGRAIDHELRRYHRRTKFHEDEFDFEAWADRAPGLVGVTLPDQEPAASLAMLVKQARRELDEVRFAVLVGMAYDVQQDAHGIPTRQVGKLREELHEGWLKERRAI